MRILVLGNGFDIAHDLPTRYSDFLDFVRAFKCFSAKSEYDKQYQQFFERIQGSSIYDEILELLGQNDRLLQYFVDIYEDRCNRGKNGWIDFELEIANIVKRLETARKIVIEENEKTEPNVVLPYQVDRIVKAVLLEQKDGKGERIYYPEGFEEGRVNALVDGLNRLTRLLEIYLSEYVAFLSIRKRVPECREKYTHVLSFNYTDTYQKLYDPDKRAKYCYIHGQATTEDSKENCNLVLGIDEYLSEYNRDDGNSFEWFKKFYQRIYKGTDTSYVDWIDEYMMTCQILHNVANPPSNELHIYGHSMDKTDKDVLSSLILMPSTVTKVYFYNDEDRSKKIINLIKIIGEKELITRTGGSKRTVIFVQTKAPENYTD